MVLDFALGVTLLSPLEKAFKKANETGGRGGIRSRNGKRAIKRTNTAKPLLLLIIIRFVCFGISDV